jgi:hypothetical protein
MGWQCKRCGYEIRSKEEKKRFCRVRTNYTHGKQSKGITVGFHVGCGGIFEKNGKD